MFFLPGLIILWLIHPIGTSELDKLVCLSVYVTHDVFYKCVGAKWVNVKKKKKLIGHLYESNQIHL